MVMLASRLGVNVLMSLGLTVLSPAANGYEANENHRYESQRCVD
jgi:hypothetical protein